jgi:hypothetical protein
MASRCQCHVVSVYIGEKATAHANRYLQETANGEAGARLMRCRICGAYWEMDEDVVGEEGERRVRLHRVRLTSTLEDWRMYEGEDRD